MKKIQIQDLKPGLVNSGDTNVSSLYKKQNNYV